MFHIPGTNQMVAHFSVYRWMDAPVLFTAAVAYTILVLVSSTQNDLSFFHISESQDRNYQLKNEVKMEEEVYHNYTCHYCLLQVADTIDLKAHLLVAHDKSVQDHVDEFGTDGRHIAEEYDDIEVVYEAVAKIAASKRTGNKSHATKQATLEGAYSLKLKKCKVVVKNSQKCRATLKRLLAEKSKEEQERLIKKHPPSEVRPSKVFTKMSLTCLNKYQVSETSVCKSVEDICGYKCDECLQIFYVHYQFFAAHLRKCKGKSAKLSPRHFHEVRYHDCNICGLRMFCDTTVVKAHVKSQHSLTLPQYRKCLNRKSVQKTVAKKMRILPNMANSDLAQVPDELFSHELGDMCLFSCDKCSFMTSSWTIMANHNFNSVHGTGTRKFKNIYVKEAMYHRCILCKMIVYCDNACLFSHIFKSHHKKMSDYKLMFNTLEGNGSSSLLNEVSNDYSTKKKIKIVASEKYFKRYDVDSEKVPQEYLTDEIGNYCEFVCYKCKHKTDSWEDMLKHLNDMHGKIAKPVTEAKWFEKRFLSEARLHRCRLCSKAVYCDKTLIRHHLANRHHITSVHVYQRHFRINNSIGNKQHDNPKELISRLTTYKRSDGFDSTYTETLGHLYCAECGYMSHAYEIMRGHLMSTKHGLPEGVEVHHLTIRAAILHECQVCFKKIPCDRSKPRNHMVKVHKFRGGLSEYWSSVKAKAKKV